MPGPTGRRHGLTLTTRGRCLLAGGCAAVACAFVLDERDLLRIGVLAAALPVVALIVTALGRVTLRATHQVDVHRMAPGEAGTVSVTLSNGGTFATPTLHAVDGATPFLTNGAQCSIPSLKRQGSALVRYPLQAQRRGHFTIGALTVQTSDPLQLCVSERAIASQTKVLVVPTITPLVGLPSPASGAAMTTGVAANGAIGGEPDVVVRPYSPGDDIRTIAWRASARHDDLLVRTLQPVTQHTATVLLDHRAAAHVGSGADSSLELTVSLAASASVHLLSHRYQLSVIDHHGSIVTSGTEGVDAVLSVLADVEEDTDEQVLTIGHRPADLLVAVLGSISLRDAHLLGEALPRESHGVAFLLDPDGWDGFSGRQQVADAGSVLQASGWQTVAIRRADNLAAAWRQLCDDAPAAVGMT